jgi:hypothetical protein
MTRPRVRLLADFVGMLQGVDGLWFMDDACGHRSPSRALARSGHEDRDCYARINSDERVWARIRDCVIVDSDYGDCGTLPMFGWPNSKVAS